ncbi:MAG: glycosyltransferase family 4 protein [Saprospiraceae bacterium]
MNIILDGIIFEQQARGGIPRIYQEIMPRICDLEASIQFFVLTHGPIRSKWPAHAQIVHRRLCSLNRYIQPGAYFWSLKKRVRSWTAGLSLTTQANDIWHSTHYTLPHKWKGPRLISAYDLLFERFASMFDKPLYHQIRVQMRNCITDADAVICISETTKKEIIDYYQIESSKLYVVPLAYSPVFRPLPLSESQNKWVGQKPFFLYVGGRGQYKNFATVLRAFEIWSRKTEIELLVVGSEWTATEKKILSEKKLHTHVRLLGHLEDEVLCMLYNRAKAFIYSSLFEGFGLPPLEAMACGCPVIASRIPSTVEVAGEIPIYFEPTAPESLRDAFDIVLNEAKNTHRLHTGFEHIKHYSWGKVAQQTLDLYQLFSS